MIERDAILEYFRREMARDISNGEPRPGWRDTRDVADNFDTSMAYIRRALDKLHDAGVIMAAKDGRTALWRITRP